VLALNGGDDFVRVNVQELALSAVRKMNEKNADCCIIFDDAGQLAGIFTERVRGVFMCFFSFGKDLCVWEGCGLLVAGAVGGVMCGGA
jgi:hypothetical protein